MPKPPLTWHADKAISSAIITETLAMTFSFA